MLPFFPGSSPGKESTCNAGDPSSMPGLGRSPGGEHGIPLQYSCLENPHGQRNLTGYSPWGCKESNTTEQLGKHTTGFQHLDGMIDFSFWNIPGCSVEKWWMGRGSIMEVGSPDGKLFAISLAPRTTRGNSRCSVNIYWKNDHISDCYLFSRHPVDSIHSICHVWNSVNCA